MVGARAASQYGLYVAAEMASGLADRDIAVVSGGAFGIDASAHRGTLAAGGQTVAVLASGVDVAYPRAHEQLLQWIADDGLVVSEVPPGSTPRRPRFLIRNRLIAALTQGTIVVEAALRSGALNTAAWAERCHREVMGVPGPVTSATSAGVHRLLRDGGAVLVTDADEAAEQIGRMGEDLAPVKPGERRTRDDLDPRARQVLEAVPVVRAAGVAQIATAAGIAGDEVLGVLGHLHAARLRGAAGKWMAAFGTRTRPRTPPVDRRTRSARSPAVTDTFADRDCQRSASAGSSRLSALGQLSVSRCRRFAGWAGSRCGRCCALLRCQRWSTVMG